MKPLVSILIPAYNSQEWIADTLRSALAQTWPNKEIIVVNDGSRDRTEDVARQFESQGVRVFTKKNQGGAAARNTAYSLSRGEYIQWLDADDLLSPDKIASQMEALDASCTGKTLLSSSWGRFLYRANHAEFIPTPLWCDLAPAEWLSRAMGQNLFMQTSTWLVSRELCEAAGSWDTTMLSDDDGEYFCRVLLQCDRIRFVPHGKVYYRATGSSGLSYIGRSDRKMDAQLRSMELHIAYLCSLEDTPRTRAACLAYLQNWLPNFYPERPDLVEKCRQFAMELGGTLHTPQLAWKYAWMRALFGQQLTRRAQILVPSVRLAVLRYWDHTLFCLEHRNLADELSSSEPDPPQAIA